MNFIFTAAFALGAIALIAAAILYACSTKFAVKEDPRIPQVLDLLPGANCGGCGYPGCSGMADALVKGVDARLAFQRLTQTSVPLAVLA